MKIDYPAILLMALATVPGGCNRNSNAPPVDKVGMVPLETRGGGADARSVYTVARYDPAADPNEDLAATVSRAAAEGKRIILEIGGQW